VVPPTGAFNAAGSGNPRLYQENIHVPAEAAGRELRSVELLWTGGPNTHTAVFALSGTPVPEPGALGLLGATAVAVLARRRGS
jgi:hypothetical protein